MDAAGALEDMVQSMEMTASPPMEEAFRANRRWLWGLAYRMTGSASDADDVVQDAFARALERPPQRVDEPLRPWLLRVTMNCAIDTLRRRKRRAYVGPWLPSPVDDERIAEEPPDRDAAATDARYEERESVSYAFLLAVEALTARARAVLLLRDVLDYSVRETADALGLSEANVKTTHHRARAAMREYDRTRRPPTAALRAETRAALERFVGALWMQDAAAAAACLTEDGTLLSDGGGEYRAALRPVIGPDRIVRFFLGLAKKLNAIPRFEVRALNGLVAVVAAYDDPPERWGPRFVLRCDTDAAGAIRALHVIVASRKLTGVAAF